MKRTLAQITVYRMVGDSDNRVVIDGDMNYMGQGIAATMVAEPHFADTVIAAIDFYRINRKMTYDELSKYIQQRVKYLTDPGKATEP
jgi:hypothetical protein